MKTKMSKAKEQQKTFAERSTAAIANLTKMNLEKMEPQSNVKYTIVRLTNGRNP